MMENLLRLVGLARELDAEMDGVAVPATAAAILNAIRRCVDVFDEEAAEDEE